MDIVFTVDYFAIITYISDYQMKDDTGTMEFIKEALKDSHNEPFLKKTSGSKKHFLNKQTNGRIGSILQAHSSSAFS